MSRKVQPIKLYGIVARSDGRGGFRVPKGYKTVYVNNRVLKVAKDGRVNIPAKMMREWGVKNDKGRYVAGVQIGYRNALNEERKVGMRLVTPAEEQLTVKRSGEIMPYEKNPPYDKRTVNPSDSLDFYFQ